MFCIFSIFRLWDNGCPRTTNPCNCGEVCGWSSENSRCELDSTTTCDECPEICITGSCLTFEPELCPLEYNPLLSCQCTEDCAEYRNCCFDYALCPGSNKFIVLLRLFSFRFCLNLSRRLFFIVCFILKFGCLQCSFKHISRVSINHFELSRKTFKMPKTNAFTWRNIKPTWRQKAKK